MATLYESTRTGKTHADRLLLFAADMGWLTSSGKTLRAEDVKGGMQDLTLLPAVTLFYPTLQQVQYDAADREGFISALQDASDAYSKDCVLYFAADSQILFDERGKKLTRRDFASGVTSLRDFTSIVLSDDGKRVFDVRSQEGAESFLQQLRLHLSVVEVIDLVDIALDCGIVTDLTEPQRNFMAYKRGGNYYSTLCLPQLGEDSSEQNRVFKFRLEGQDASSSDFYVTFDAQQNDIRSETEYANRASVFIDTLMKLVMAKYNVLIVHKAAIETDEQIAAPPVYDGYRELVCEYDNDDTPTESTQSQLKVMIRYRDTVKRTSFTANVIDDIFITFDEEGGERWGFSKITPGQSEPTPEPIVFGDSEKEVERAKKELENVRRVKELSENRDVKYTIFEALRRNESTNLYKLIKQREAVYRESAASDKEIPKVEFSLTPLTIYSNHIVSRTVRYHITGQNPAVSTVYECKFDPINPRGANHSVQVNGENVRLSSDNKLVIMLQEGDPASGATYVPACESKCVRLSEANPTHYPEEVYGDVFYDEKKCVPASATGYTGLSGKAQFYRGDLEESALSSGGVKYLRREMIKMPVGAKYFMDDASEPTPKTVSRGESKYAPEHCAQRECPVCHTAYFAADEGWSKVENKYSLETGGHCCPTCVGKVVNEQGVYVIKNGRERIYCVDHPEYPRFIHACSQCREDDKDGLLFAYNGAVLRCSICGEIVCDNHSAVKDGERVCKLCLAKGRNPATPFGNKGASAVADTIWRKVRINFPLSSRDKLNYSLHGRWLRVFSMKGGKAKKVYLFVSRKGATRLEDKKFVFLKAKSLKNE